MTIGKTLLAALAAAALPTMAGAIPIASNSQLNVGGFNIGVGTTTTINLATGLDFTAGAGPTPGTAGALTSVTGTSGTFSGISCSGPCGTIQDLLNFSTFAPITNFYVTTAGVSFDLLTLGTPTTIAPGAGQLATLIISGTGTFTYAGFDPTPGVFTLTTQGGAATTFSASTVASPTTTPTPTPEPASLALLGAGLLGLATLRRRA